MEPTPALNAELKKTLKVSPVFLSSACSAALVSLATQPSLGGAASAQQWCHAGTSTGALVLVLVCHGQPVMHQYIQDNGKLGCTPDINFSYSTSLPRAGAGGAKRRGGGPGGGDAGRKWAGSIDWLVCLELMTNSIADPSMHACFAQATIRHSEQLVLCLSLHVGPSLVGEWARVLCGLARRAFQIAVAMKWRHVICASLGDVALGMPSGILRVCE